MAGTQCIDLTNDPDVFLYHWSVGPNGAICPPRPPIGSIMYVINREYKTETFQYPGEREEIHIVNIRGGGMIEWARLLQLMQEAYVTSFYVYDPSRSI